MVTSRRSWSRSLSLVSLLALSACGDGEDDTTTSTTSTTQSPTNTPSDPGTTTAATTGPAGTTDTGDETTTVPGTTPTTDPTTGPGTTPTTEDPTTTTDPGTTTTDPGTTTDPSTTTGGFDPADLPMIPDDGMPASAHQKQVPLGTSDAKLGYYEYLPPGYGGGDKYPLMVFLHGIGENGNGVEDLGKVLNNGPPALIKNDQWAKDRPFVVLSPQHGNDGGCPGSAEIHDFIDFATTHYDINPGRIYLTGLSCGAIGAWGYLGQYLDEQITALVPIAGDGNGAFGQSGCMLGRVPIWAFHGDADGTVNVNGTINPVTQLQACDPKPDVEMVIYPGVGHDSWTMTYNLAAGHDIYAWFLARYKP